MANMGARLLLLFVLRRHIVGWFSRKNTRKTEATCGCPYFQKHPLACFPAKATWEQEELTRRCDPGRNGLPAAQLHAFGSMVVEKPESVMEHIQQIVLPQNVGCQKLVFIRSVRALHGFMGNIDGSNVCQQHGRTE